MKARYTFNFLFFVISIGINFILNSCSKTNLYTEKEPIVIGKDLINVDFAVAQDYDDVVDKFASMSGEQKNLKTAQVGDFFVEMSSGSHNKFSKIADTNSPNTNWINFSYGTPYKIIILNSNNEYVTEKLAFSGNAVALDVVLQPNYKIIAYTYNVPDTLLYTHKIGSLQDRTVLSKPWIVPNTEFYYATSPIYVDGSGRKSISLKFVPKVARIGVSIDVRAIFAKIQGPIKIQTLSNNYFKGGRFDLLDQSISNITTRASFGAVDTNGNIIATSLLSRYMSNVSNSYTGNNVVTGYFYTLIDANNSTIAEQDGASNYFARVNFVGNSISGTLNNEIVYDETYVDSNPVNSIKNHKEALNHTFSFKDGFTDLAHGKSKTFTFTIYRGFLYGNLLWSTTNLIHKGGVNYRTENYIFRKNPYDGFQKGSSDYWAPNKLLPGFSSGDMQTGDPCSKVYPVGEWRMPKLTEFQLLFRDGTGLTRSRDISDANTTQSHTLISSQNSSIRFYYFGRTAITSSNNVPSYTYYNDGTGATGEANYLYMLGNNTVSEKHYYSGAWQSLGYYGGNTDINEPNLYRNVRCVRDIPTI